MPQHISAPAASAFFELVASLALPAGLSKSFPLDSSLFDSWLAQSVQITADDMLSQWTLGAQHRDKSGSLLSDQVRLSKLLTVKTPTFKKTLKLPPLPQPLFTFSFSDSFFHVFNPLQLLQGEESLLNLMMENSMQSAWKTPQLGRKPGGGSKTRCLDSPSPSQMPQAVEASLTQSLWPGVAEEKSAHRAERPRSSSRTLQHHVHHHKTRSSDLHRDPPPQPPISKMDSCHISEDPDQWDGVRPRSVGMASGPGSGFTATLLPSASNLELTVPEGSGSTRLRLPRQGKSRGRGLGGAELEPRDVPVARKETSSLDGRENRGYFSDGERSHTDTRAGRRKLRLAQLHSGSEDLLRRSVLAS